MESILVASAVLSIALTVILLPSTMIPIVHAPWVGYPGPDNSSDCDHIGGFNTTADKFTAVGLNVYYGYDNNPPTYVHGEWFFERGYGGTHPATGFMICAWYYYPTSGLHYDAPDFVHENRWVPGYGWVYAYYQDWIYTNYNLPNSPYATAYTGSYFQNPNYPYDEWYIYSSVSLTAGNP
jgi:hypothetical protein